MLVVSGSSKVEEMTLSYSHRENLLDSIPILNVHELMSSLSGTSNDQDFSKFVTMTMNMRDL